MSWWSSVLAWSAQPSAAVGVLVSVTLLLLAAVAVQTLVRRASAATRHLVWHLALAGSLGIAAAVPFIPGVPLRIGILPAVTAMSPSATQVSSEASAPAFKRPLPSGSTTVSRSGITTDSRSGELPFSAGSLLVIWAVGALMLGLWLALGHVALARLARGAEPVTDREWLETLRAEAEHCGWRSPIRLLRSARVGSPVTWRARRLVVLLPVESRSWSAERRRAVIAHELAHGCRGDHQANLVARLACAIYWFHPLVWHAARRLRAESERACDDFVLTQGTPNDEYASLLIDVARSSRALHVAGLVAIGMARPSELEGRVLAVLDEKRTRKAPPRRVVALAWAALALVAWPLVAVRPALLPREQAFAAASDGDDQGRTPEYTENATPGQRLELDLETGGAVKITGWSQSKVQVHASLGGSDWRDTKVTLDRVSGGLRLRSWQGVDRSQSSTSHRFEIQVPKKYDVRIHSAGGGLEITNVEGDFRGNTGGGEIEIRSVKGYASLTTGGGEIHVSESHLSGAVSTGGGEVTLSHVSGGLRASSGSGPVVYGEDGSGRTTDMNDVEVDGDDVHVHGSSVEARADKAGVVHISRAGGNVHLDEAPKGAAITTGGGNVRVGRSGGDVEVGTGGGDIEIGPASGSVSAHTGAGRVAVKIAPGAGPEHSVEIASGSGAAVIELPANLSARFEIETAYTEKYGKKTRIVSDFPLQLSETSTWDATQGTPRKYVRGAGTAGKGEGLVEVKIVNGDVTIRKSKS
jgi:beta-lactamase regulating signal transducer with metallopeptidase domain/DUF4097 and DUF4098 domain-containing protein YvlB